MLKVCVVTNGDTGASVFLSEHAFLHLYIICTLRRFEATHEALGINLLHNERAQNYVTEDCSAQASVTAFVSRRKKRSSVVCAARWQRAHKQ